MTEVQASTADPTIPGVYMVNGKQLTAFIQPFLTSGHSKCFTTLPLIHSFMHTFTHRRRSQPRRATASWSGAVRVRRLAQGHLHTQLGGAGDRTGDLPVTSRPALPPEPHAAPVHVEHLQPPHSGVQEAVGEDLVDIELCTIWPHKLSLPQQRL